LQEYVDQFDLKDCSDELKHSKVPYVAILAQSIKTYMAQNDGNLPKTWDQKKAYKASIGEYRNQDAAVSEENFDEAVEFARFAYILPKLLPDTQAVLDDPAAQTATKDSDLFWVCARAVNEWRAAEGAGLLPVSTDVPDMASTTTDYIALKKVFKAKAAADAAAILDRVVKLVGVDRYAAEAQTIDAYARYFVANVRYLRVVRTDSIAQEFEAKTFNTEALTEYLQEYFYDLK
jgi:amyloid beta precursor protein binding protein 1